MVEPCRAYSVLLCLKVTLLYYHSRVWCSDAFSRIRLCVCLSVSLQYSNLGYLVVVQKSHFRQHVLAAACIHNHQKKVLGNFSKTIRKLASNIN